MTTLELHARRARRRSGADRVGDERALALAYQQDPAGRDRVVQALAPIARSIARRYAYTQESQEDLEQVALVGLVKALRGFDPDRACSFAAYAYPTITGELRRHFRDTAWAAHVPRREKQLALAVRDGERTSATGRVDDDALAERLGVPVSDIATGRRASGAMFADSLSAPAGDEPAVREPAVVDSGYEAVEDRQLAAALCADLEAYDRTVVWLRFDRNLSQREIGERVGRSQMQICRDLRRILDTLAAADVAAEPVHNQPRAGVIAPGG